MGPKEPTPHQISRGLEYVHKEPSFLAKLKGKQQADIKAKQKFENYTDGQDDDDYDELEGAQVVVLDKHGKEVHEKPPVSDDEDDKNKKDDADADNDEPAVDANGRILFRARKKTKEPAKRKEREDDTKVKSSKKKKAKNTTNLLSFENDDE
ncbi:uncharacterized protein BYT42DRAFT_611093 [Radiomyces spectabilis]|uniref:uncharacterized protein n=1 Tax=Radiomyces spectabilis TaxID=64574 RepID=UPI00221FF254|nr:uncharacterized protein BYT42DRAFT_611093 [Radiomyces spectabilis]KAI8388011.1 hypothetical protein BYT42DRAFT_611093 [Radiomyces spectabilis]